jgi:hypothetical protein
MYQGNVTVEHTVEKNVRLFCPRVAVHENAVSSIEVFANPVPGHFVLYGHVRPRALAQKEALARQRAQLLHLVALVEAYILCIHYTHTHTHTHTHIYTHTHTFTHTHTHTFTHTHTHIRIT